MDNKNLYTQRKIQAEQEEAKVQKRINYLVVLRLAVFFAGVFATYQLLDVPALALSVFIIALLVFVYLVKVHADLDGKRKYFQRKAQLNQVELEVLKGDFRHLDTGKEFLNPNHYYSYDIDLFGEGSFFQYFNRTKTQGGKLFLSRLLQANDIEGVEEKQNAIKDLSEDVEWRQHFWASLDKEEQPEQIRDLLQWVVSYQSYLSKWRAVLFIFPLLSIVLIYALSIGLIPTLLFVGWFGLGLLITGKFVAKTGEVNEQANKLAEQINHYATLLEAVEKKEFKSKNNRFYQEQINTSTEKASTSLRKMSVLLNRLNSRENLLVAIVGNALFLWELNAVYRFEKWLETHKQNLPHWFETIYYFDAVLSCANYAFNHPSDTYPLISTNNLILQAQQLGHPLLKPQKRIDNDIEIEKNSFVIITGANMAGKSTFLRAVSLSLVLANAGMPVCAKRYTYTPIKLITSMRTSDSLKDDESYFFSELKRLKFIVDSIQNDTYFIVLDEILKGTNSKDKEAGSKKFVERLVRSGSTGIIATHDLSLCEISNHYPQVVNHYFDAEIINDQLHFDYKIKDGVCQNMNASFLLKKMGIVEN